MLEGEEDCSVAGVGTVARTGWNEAAVAFRRLGELFRGHLSVALPGHAAALDHEPLVGIHVRVDVRGDDGVWVGRDDFYLKLA